MAAIEQQNGGAGTLVFALVHHQVGVIKLDRNGRAIALHGIEKCSANVHVKGVAEFILLRRAARLHAGGQIARVVPAKAALAQRGE